MSKHFVIFLEIQSIFKKYHNIIRQQNVNFKDFYVSKMLELPDVFSHVPNCHFLKNKIVKRFIIFRLKIPSKRKAGLGKSFSSRSLSKHV